MTTTPDALAAAPASTAAASASSSTPARTTPCASAPANAGAELDDPQRRLTLVLGERRPVRHDVVTDLSGLRLPHLAGAGRVSRSRRRPAAWVQQDLDRIVAEHDGQPWRGHVGEYRVPTPTGPLSVRALVLDEDRTILEFTRWLQPPDGSQEWLNDLCRRYLAAAWAAGIPSYQSPAATRSSGDFQLATPDAAEALAQWLPQEIAWQAEADQHATDTLTPWQWQTRHAQQHAGEATP